MRSKYGLELENYLELCHRRFMVYNATFNNISVISWRSSVIIVFYFIITFICLLDTVGLHLFTIAFFSFLVIKTLISKLVGTTRFWNSGKPNNIKFCEQ
jgi:hypothetical protein